MNVNFVVFDTSGNGCDVMLCARRDGQLHVWARREVAASEPAQHVLPMLDAVLRQGQVTRADVSAVAFGQGPGGFTGLRVACGLAQGLAFALDIPVIPLSSLLAAAEHDRQDAAPHAQAWVVLQDARMQELYAAVYTWDTALQRWQTLHPPCLIGVPSVPQWLATVRQTLADAHNAPLVLCGVGNALAAYPSLATAFDRVGRTDRPCAQALAHLALQALDRGDTLPPDLAAPLYIRDKIAYTTQERSQGLGGNPKADGVVVAPSPSVIAPMTEHHLPQVVEIERTVQSFPWTLGNFRDALASGYGAWVALRDDTVQGFCVVMFAPDVAHLLVLAVAREHQRCGMGQRLVHHAQQQVLRKGLTELILEVRPSNQRARAFYQYMGFETLSVRKDYYPAGRGQREDALVLRKGLHVPSGKP